MEPKRKRRPAFPSTRWTMIRRIDSGSPAERETALGEVCVMYWPPVFAFICSQGHSRHDAEDLTQEFFRQFLSKNHFAGLTPDQGKLRSYLLKSVRHFLTSEHRRRTCAKRGGGEEAVHIDPSELEALVPAVEQSSALDPERIFDRLWASTVLDLAFRRMEKRYRESGKGEFFDFFSALVRAESGKIDQAAIAERLGMSPVAVRVSAYRFRQNYGKILREIVSETLEPGGSAREELSYLMSVFS